ncbi:hypothetical protein BDD12DRAFT_482756 [Trichophaea hybrida]|nr:hypothetical protein BDD12DRAFT_482756 [Trichophaea hybrida]
MSFGYSTSDFICLLQLSLRVIKSYQDVPKQLQDISKEVNGLNTALNRTKEVIDHHPSKRMQTPSWRNPNVAHKNREGGIFGKFFNIKNRGKNVRDCFRWDENAVATLRMRIMVNTMLMMAYNTSIHSL